MLCVSVIKTQMLKECTLIKQMGTNLTFGFSWILFAQSKIDVVTLVKCEQAIVACCQVQPKVSCSRGSKPYQESIGPCLLKSLQFHSSQSFFLILFGHFVSILFTVFDHYSSTLLHWLLYIFSQSQCLPNNTIHWPPLHSYPGNICGI